MAGCNNKKNLCVIQQRSYLVQILKKMWWLYRFRTLYPRGVFWPIFLPSILIWISLTTSEWSQWSSCFSLYDLWTSCNKNQIAVIAWWWNDKIFLNYCLVSVQAGFMYLNVLLNPRRCITVCFSVNVLVTCVLKLGL